MLFNPTKIQRKATRFALKNKYSILSLDMGLGKTGLLLHIYKIVGGRLLVSCPAHLIETWHDEINKWFPNEWTVSYFKKGADVYWPFDSDIVVISKDILKKHPMLFEWCDVLGIDEAHELKNMSSQVSQAFHKEVYENSIRRVHPLTGTAILNRVEEFYSLICLCQYNPKMKSNDFLDRFPDSISFADYFSFRREFFIYVGNMRIPVIKWEGFRKSRKPELRRYLRPVYIRFNAPPGKVTMKPVIMSTIPEPKLLAEFNAYYGDEVRGQDRSSTREKKTAALKKVPFTTTYVKGLLNEVECVVVYTCHIESCEALAAAFKVQPHHSKVSKKKRRQAYTDFKTGKTKVLVATVGSLYSGVDLTRSWNIVLNDYPWSPGILDQVFKRIDRMNQKAKKCVAHLIFGSPQDKTIWEVIKEKEDVINQASKYIMRKRKKKLKGDK